MRDTVIRKTAADLRVAPNLPASDEARTAFSWDGIRDELGGGVAGLNLGRLAVDRPVGLGRADRIALRFLPAQGEPHDLTYAELARLTNRFANALRSLGIGPGDRVFVRAGRIAPLYVAVLGSLKNGSVVTPLFSA